MPRLNVPLLVLSCLCPAFGAELSYTAAPVLQAREASLIGMNEVGDVFWRESGYFASFIASESTEVTRLSVYLDTCNHGYMTSVNNARQYLGTFYFQCFHNPNVLGLGSGFVIGSYVQLLDPDWAAYGINNAGRVLVVGPDLQTSREWGVWDGYQAKPQILHPPGEGRILGGWNDFEQTVVAGDDGVSYIWDTRTGETSTLGVAFERVRLINGRGCVAGNALRRLPDSVTGDLVLICNGQNIVLAEEQAGVALTPLALNDRGWLLYGFHTEYVLWDGEAIHVVRDLLPADLKDVGFFSIVGPNNDGSFAISVQGTVYRLTLNTQLEALPEVSKPEAGQGISGHGEYMGCEAVTGWVRDWNRAHTPTPVELYEGTRLIAAAIATTWRADWEMGYQINIPPSVVADGKPHTFDVRYGGTSTVIEGASGTVQCPAQ